MSLLGRIGGFAGKVAGKLSGVAAVASFLPGIGGLLGKGVTAIKGLSTVGKVAAGAGTLAAAGGLAAAVHAARSSPTAAMATGGARGRKITVHEDGSMEVHRRRRGHGLTGRDLKGFNRTIHLLKKVGMVPRKLSRARIHRSRHDG